VPGEGGTAATGQQAEAIVELGRDLGRREHLHPGSGQLDGKGNAIQAATHLGNGGDGSLRQLKSRLESAGSLDKEPAGVRTGQALQGGHLLQAGYGQRRHRPSCLAG
jgi:hypothetical protein